VKLTAVGCSGSMPGPDSTASCYLVAYSGYRVVLDLGNGSLGALQSHVSLDDIDAIVISHQHADHCLDLIPLIVRLKWDPRRSGKRIRLIGPSTLPARLTAAYDYPACDLALGDLFDFSASGAMDVGPFGLTVMRANHPGEAYSVRLEAAGRSLTFSGDTGTNPGLVDLARGTDLALFEAGWPAGSPSGTGLHLSPAEAGEHARAAGAARLVVTHVPPWASRDEARVEAEAAFGSAVEVAVPGAVFEI